jgi:5-methylthioadenosine/S-adenosylhomocysteine deaminase
VRIGLSPHAPYTVSAPLLEALSDRAAALGRPLAMHLAESAAEVTLVRDGTGPFAERLAARGIAVSARRRSPVRWSLDHGLGRGPSLCIHLVHTDDDDRRALAAAGVAVAHCPWSNELLGNGSADLGALRAAGLAVGLGTDSVAAGNAMDLFAEMRQAPGTGSWAPSERLRFLAADGARALGLADAGELRPGAWADVTAVAMRRPPLREAGGPEEAIARYATAADIVGTWVAGVPRFRDGTWPGVDAEAARSAWAAAHDRARALALSVIGPPDRPTA